MYNMHEGILLDLGTDVSIMCFLVTQYAMLETPFNDISPQLCDIRIG